MRQRALIAMVLMLALVFTACGDDQPAADSDLGAEEPSPEADGGEVVITAVEYEFDLPDELPAGPTTFSLINDGEEKHFIDIVKLTDDAPPVLDLIKLPEKKVGEFFEGQPNHIADVKPGETSSKPLEIDLVAGRYGYVCFIEAKDGTPHAFLGMAGEFVVQ